MGHALRKQEAHVFTASQYPREEERYDEQQIVHHRQRWEFLVDSELFLQVVRASKRYAR
jgi:hypothetical protein